MADTTTGSELMIVDGCGSDDGYENYKRQKCIDSTKHEKTSYAAILGGKDVIGDDYDIDSRCDFVKALLSDFMEKNEKDAKDCVEEDVVEVVMETNSMLATFDRFYDRGVILYFTSKLPLVSWIKQWLNSFIMPNCVEDVYVGPRGFYDVVFRSSEHRTTLMAKVPIFFDRRLVHVMEWVPVVDYKDLLKQQCPIWVTVDCSNSFFWDLLPGLMSQIGKVLVAPHVNSLNKCRFCMLWDTSCKLPGWLSIDTSRFGRFRFKLQWETFAGHCFKCGKLGHFMAECQYHGELSLENNVKGKNKEDVEKDIVSMVDMVMDEGTSHGLERDPKVHGHVRGVGEENGVCNNDGPNVEDGEWHQVKHKIKGKGVAIQRESKNTYGTTLPKDNLRLKEGFKKNPWQKQVRNQRLSNQLQFDSSGRVVRPQLNQGLRSRGARQQNPNIGGGDVVHTNPYAALEQVVSTFMNTLAHKEQVLTKGVK